MILKRLVLENYKQHSSIDQTFSGNVIGIIGDNGSGKSNLLGAMHFALAGEQPGFKKTDLLKWGTTSGHVELWFSHNGVEGHIYRSLNGSEATFKFGDDKYVGISKVAEGIIEHLNLDKDLLKQTVFVRQAEIDDILFTEPRIRELAFQRLCGIGEAAKINKQLGEILSTLATPPNYDEQISEGTLRASQMADRVMQLTAAKANMDATRAKCPSMADMQVQLASLERAKSACRRLIGLTADAEKYAGLIKTYNTELATLPTEVIDLTEVDKAIEETRNMITAADDYGKALQAWESLGKQLVALGDAPVKPAPLYTEEQVEYLQKTVAELSAVYNDAAGNLKLYKGVMEASRGVLAKDAQCPLCGNTITDTNYLATKIKVLEETVTTTNPQKVQQDLNVAVSTNLSNEQIYERGVASYTATRDILTSKFAEAEKALDSVKESAKLRSQSAQLTARLVALTQQRQAFIATTTRRTTLQSQVKSTQEYLINIEKNTASEKMALPNLVVGTAAELANEEQAADVKITALNAAMGEIRKIDEQLAQLSGMLMATEAGLNELTKTLKDLEDRRSKQGAYKAAIDVLTQVRDWFHYGNGPHTLANSVLNNMTADVNSFLEKFGAPFSVLPGAEALGFKYIMTDGSAMPAGEYPDAMHLSGGQKIQLAVSFRFASYCMFASKIGLLSLDEPTVYLDDKNVGNFCVLMEKIRDIAQKMNLQVLIATHERSVLPFMDSIIDLTKIHDTSKT